MRRYLGFEDSRVAKTSCRCRGEEVAATDRHGDRLTLCGCVLGVPHPLFFSHPVVAIGVCGTCPHSGQGTPLANPTRSYRQDEQCVDDG